MRAEFDDKAKLNPDEKKALAAYAESLLDRGWCAPTVNDDTEVVQVALKTYENVNELLDVGGVHVHFSGGHMWQKSPVRAMTEPLEPLLDGLYPISRLREKNGAAVLDVVRFVTA